MKDQQEEKLVTRDQHLFFQDRVEKKLLSRLAIDVYLEN